MKSRIVFYSLVFSFFIGNTLASAQPDPPELPDDFVLKQCEAFDQQSTSLDMICECTDSLALRKRLANLILEAEAKKDALWCENVRSLADICGGFLDEDHTYVNITAPSLPLTLEPEEQAQLTATIVGKGSCEDPNADVQLEGGSISWWSDNPDIASVSQSGLVTAGKPGSTSIHAIVDEYPWLQGGVGVTVIGKEDPIVNVAFVVYNGAHSYFSFPPWGWDYYSSYAGDWYDDMAASFGGTFDLSVVKYNRSSCSHISECDYDSDPCDQSRTLVPFVSAAGPGPVLKYNWQSAWESLVMVCDYDPWDLGTSLYSALIDTINNGYWDPKADVKAIIVLPAASTCYFLGQGACNAETGTGRTLTDVINAANNKGVNILVINSHTNNLSECGGDDCFGQGTTGYCYQWVAARDEYQAIAKGTNGGYYAAFCDYPHYTDAVKQAIFDIYQRANSPN